MRSLPIAILLATALSAQTADVKPVEVRVHTDRTAMWIGDRVTYTIELRCAPDVDLLLDDLSKDRLRVSGGEIAEVIEDHDEGDGPRVRRMHYRLTTYRVDAREIKIDPLVVRYFSRRNMDAVAQATPAGQVTVPPTVVAIRSTLADSGRLPELRYPVSGRLLPKYLRFVQPVGLALIALAILPTLVFALDIAGRARAAWARRAVHRSRREHRTSFEQLKTLSPSSDAEQIRAYEQLDTVVREHLRASTGVPAHALTPGELRRSLSQRSPAFATDEVEELLTRCERARYAPEPPAREGWAESIRCAEHVMRRRR